MKRILIVFPIVGIVVGLALVFRERQVEPGGEQGHPTRVQQRQLEPDKDADQKNDGVRSPEQEPDKDADRKLDQDEDKDSKIDKDADRKRVEKRADEREVKDKKGEASEAGGIKLGEKEQGLGGIVTASLQETRERPELQALGSVVDIQELIDFRSAFINATAQLKKTESALSLAQAEFERQRLLRNQNQNVSEKAFQSAEDAFHAEQANLMVAKENVATVETNTRQHWGSKLADESLHDTDEGQRLLKREAFLLQVTLPTGSPVFEPPEEVSVQSSSADRIEGKFVSVCPRTDPKLQGRSFFYLIPSRQSPAGFLPGMSVSAAIPIGDSEPTVVVPLSAVVWLHGKAWAYIQEEPDRFIRREMSTDRPNSDGWLESPDFSEGHAIVVHGAQALLSQESQSQIQVGEEGDNE